MASLVNYLYQSRHLVRCAEVAPVSARDRLLIAAPYSSECYYHVFFHLADITYMLGAKPKTALTLDTLASAKTRIRERLELPVSLHCDLGTYRERNVRSRLVIALPAY
jgi:hypothetical protein